MKKETINTFLKGMVKDLHPLSTPNDVLTDALNGTLITYNGNEGALLNDMGNVKIKNALLKSGYVPVGMKEHGGIIYVAAYNPETKKGLVGSFPSPKLLWEGEDWNINKPVDISTNVNIPESIYKNKESKFIVNETVRQSIFTTADGVARIFHPGDKYIIKFAAKDSLEEYINKGYMDIQLGVVKSDGGIEIMKTWTKGTSGDFLYNGNLSSGSCLNEPSIVQVFDASSSGEMIFIINLHTIESFNLVREYSLQNDDKIKVTFTGEATKDNETISSTESDGYLKLATGEDDVDKDTVEVIEGEGNPSMIYPNVPFGIILRMGRPVNVDFGSIRKNNERFGEWRFFVTETYVKIGWAYDFYNLDGSLKIEYIRMYFYKLEDNTTPVSHIDFLRESYNGNFEDYINYADFSLQYRRIYIVKIVKKLSNEDDESKITYKMLYLSKLYNDLYNGFYINNAIGLSGENSSTNNLELKYSCANDLAINVKLESSLEVDLIDSNAKINCPNNVEYNVPTTDIKSSMYITPAADLDLTLENVYLYVTDIINEYSSKLKIVGNYKGVKEEYIGVPKKNLINSILQKCSISSIQIDRSGKEWQSSSLLKLFSNVEEPDHSKDYQLDNKDKDYIIEGSQTIEDNILTIDKIKFKDNRFVQGLISDVKYITYESKGLEPLYSPNYSIDRKNEIAPYWNAEDTFCISGAGDGDNQTMHYNSRIMPAGYVIEGPDAGGGCDDGGLFTASNYMNRPMTNIFSGNHGEDAEIAFDNLGENSPVASGSGSMDFISSHGENGGKFLDYLGDNYLITCWKFTDGDSRFVNLLTKRNIPAKSTSKWPRLDVMLRCLLSLIFVVNRIQKKDNYVTTNENFYRYLSGNTKLRINLLYNPENLNTGDIMVPEDSSDDNNTLNRIFENNWSNKVDNLIPNIKANVDSNLPPIEIEIPDFYNIDIILGYYLGATYNTILDNSNDLDISAIYKLDMNETTYNASMCAKQNASGNLPKANSDGTYEWIGTPKCTKISSSSRLEIHRWDDATSKVTFPYFYSTFTTKAAELLWDDIPEGEWNEVYAKTSNPFRCGNWTDASDDPAPDMYMTTLFSPQISALNDR